MHDPTGIAIAILLIYAFVALVRWVVKKLGGK